MGTQRGSWSFVHWLLFSIFLLSMIDLCAAVYTFDIVNKRLQQRLNLMNHTPLGLTFPELVKSCREYLKVPKADWPSVMVKVYKDKKCCMGGNEMPVETAINTFGLHEIYGRSPSPETSGIHYHRGSEKHP